MMALDDKPIVLPGVIIRNENKNKFLVFNPFTRGLHFITEFSKEILDMCNGTTTITNVIEQIVSKYDIEYDEAKEQVIFFFNELESRRVIENHK